MEKIKVLFVMMQMELGGSESLVYNIVKNIDYSLFSPAIAWFYGDKIVDQFKKLEIPLFHIPKNKRFDFSTMQQLKDIIKKNEIDVVNAHHFMSFVYSFYGCKIMNKTKLVYTEHSEWEINLIPWKWKKIGQFLLKHTDAAVGVSKNVQESLKYNFNINQNKVFTIQNGVNLNSFSKKDISLNLKKELGIDINKKVVGIIANLKRVKNHLFLLHAFREVVQSYKNVHLLIVGQGFKGDSDNTEKEIKNYINENRLNPNISLLGFRPDIPEILNVLDIFCLTSLKEGLPISLIEAMAVGIPVIGTDVDGIKDIIVNGKNGFLVPIGNPVRLKDIIVNLLQNPSLSEELGNEGRRMVTKLYSLNSCISGYQNLFLSVLNH